MSDAMSFERKVGLGGIKEIHIFISRPIATQVLILRADGSWEEKEGTLKHWFGYYDVAGCFHLSPEMLRDESGEPIFQTAFDAWWKTVEDRGLNKPKD